MEKLCRCRSRRRCSWVNCGQARRRRVLSPHTHRRRASELRATLAARACGGVRPVTLTRGAALCGHADTVSTTSEGALLATGWGTGSSKCRLESPVRAGRMSSLDSIHASPAWRGRPDERRVLASTLSGLLAVKTFLLLARAHASERESVLERWLSFFRALLLSRILALCHAFSLACFRSFVRASSLALSLSLTPALVLAGLLAR